MIAPADGTEEIAYPVSRRSRLLVSEGESVTVGQKLVNGAANPHDVLRVLGQRAVQQHLVGEVQNTYRSQGVSIHDKHIEIIVRQMLRRVTIIETGRLRAARRRPGRARQVRVGEPPRGVRGRPARLRPSAADGYHEGLAGHRVLALGRLLPGDDPGADRRRDPRQVGLAGRPEGERDHRQADPGRYRHARYRNIKVDPTEEARVAAFSMAGYDESDYYGFASTGGAIGPAVPLDDYGYDDYR